MAAAPSGPGANIAACTGIEISQIRAAWVRYTLRNAQAVRFPGALASVSS